MLADRAPHKTNAAMNDGAGDKRKKPGPQTKEWVVNPHGQPCESCGYKLSKSWFFLRPAAEQAAERVAFTSYRWFCSGRNSHIDGETNMRSSCAKKKKDAAVGDDAREEIEEFLAESHLADDV